MKKDDLVSVAITEKEYNYLVAVDWLRKHLLNRREVGQCSFIGTEEEVKDMKLRLEGLYW